MSAIIFIIRIMRIGRAHPWVARWSAPKSTAAAGQGLVEYALILVLVAIVCIIALSAFGDQVSALLGTSGNALTCVMDTDCDSSDAAALEAGGSTS